MKRLAHGHLYKQQTHRLECHPQWASIIISTLEQLHNSCHWVSVNRAFAISGKQGRHSNLDDKRALSFSVYILCLPSSFTNTFSSEALLDFLLKTFPKYLRVEKKYYTIIIANHDLLGVYDVMLCCYVYLTYICICDVSSFFRPCCWTRSELVNWSQGCEFKPQLKLDKKF